MVNFFLALLFSSVCQGAPTPKQDLWRPIVYLKPEAAKSHQVLTTIAEDPAEQIYHLRKAIIMGGAPPSRENLAKLTSLEPHQITDDERERDCLLKKISKAGGEEAHNASLSLFFLMQNKAELRIQRSLLPPAYFKIGSNSFVWGGFFLYQKI
ncbi:hypothetical protein OAN21_01775, partial [Alphaproteobacteria bacterium]|nr:hypothetical protein [Alphaproteobacteria bacterium]